MDVVTRQLLKEKTSIVALMVLTLTLLSKSVLKAALVMDAVYSTAVTKLIFSCTELGRKFIVKILAIKIIKISTLNGKQYSKLGGILEP